MDKLYTIIEVANKLNLSDKTLRRWEEAGRFVPSRTLGNQRRYSLEDLQILDAIKHGTINEQKDLLTVDQAAKICGVSPTTILRWEDKGKIHPLITSGNTYYPRQKLIEKLEELRHDVVGDVPYIEPLRDTPAAVVSTEILDAPVKEEPTNSSKLTPLADNTPNNPNIFSVNPTLATYATNILITILLIFSYHLLFNSRGSLPISPQTNSNQATSITSDPTFDLLKTILDPSGALTTTTLTSKIGLISPLLSLSPSSAPAKPNPGTIYYDASSESLKIFKATGWVDLSPSTILKASDVTLFSSSATLPKGKNQVSLSQEKLTSTTPVTITFTNDYAPAKKYWVTVDQGSLTLHTDFPVAQDSPFNYNFVTPNSTISAVPKF